MRLMSLMLTLSAVTGLAACGNGGEQKTVAPAEPAPPQTSQNAQETAPPMAEAQGSGLQGGQADWRSVARAEDASALGRLDQAWRLARAEAEDAGFASQVEKLGPLVDPNAAQAGRVQPSPGEYRCRTIKLGNRNEGPGLAYVDYPWFSCSVALTPGGDLVLTKTTGSQRTQGLLYPEGDRRLVYVGAQAWGDDEKSFPRYGDKAERDQVGVLERIGQNRWRLAIPWPKQEAKLELLEIIR
ncbi:hypothetical protein LTR94_024744 [Friedmanniomyces endolithicus]|nr:hypothetical protein LTR94_024744 [Friedmanniomyces endolithicus]